MNLLLNVFLVYVLGYQFHNCLREEGDFLDYLLVYVEKGECVKDFIFNNRVVSDASHEGENE